LLEALAQGTPVVSTAELGTKFVLKAGCGALIVPESKAELAAAVAKVLQDEPLHDELRARGRAYAKTWSSHALAQRLADIYRAVPGVGTQRHENLLSA
jgi:glycosyltransferase involved in cell wall biosynthesis